MNRVKRDLKPKSLSERLSVTSYLLKIVDTYSFDLHNLRKREIRLILRKLQIKSL